MTLRSRSSRVPCIIWCLSALLFIFNFQFESCTEPGRTKTEINTIESIKSINWELFMDRRQMYLKALWYLKIWSRCIRRIIYTLIHWEITRNWNVPFNKKKSEEKTWTLNTNFMHRQILWHGFIFQYIANYVGLWCYCARP